MSLLTVPQLAARWQVSEWLVWRLIREGKIPVLRIPPKLVRIREKDAEGAWQSEGTRTLAAGSAMPSSSSRGRRARACSSMVEQRTHNPLCSIGETANLVGLWWERSAMTEEEWELIEYMAGAEWPMPRAAIIFYSVLTAVVVSLWLLISS